MNAALRGFVFCVGAMVYLELGDLRAQDVKERAALAGHPGDVTHVAFTPNGKILAAGSQDGAKRQTKLWDIGVPRALATVEGNWPDFSPDGKWLATKVDDKTVALWDSASSKEIRRFSNAEDCVFGPVGNVLGVMGSDKKVTVWDTKTWKEVRTLDYARITYFSDGKGIVAQATNGDIAILNAETGKLVNTLKGHKEVPMVAISPDGKLLASNEFALPDAILWDIAKHEKRATLAAAGSRQLIGRLVFSPDSKILATAIGNADFTVIGGQYSVRLWDSATGKEVATFSGHPGGVAALAISPDAKFMATAASDDLIRVWDMKTGDQIGKWKAHKVKRIGIHSLAFSPDGSILASGSEDDVVRIWETKAFTNR